MAKRRNFPTEVKVEAFRRAKANGGLCEGGCGCPLRTGHFAYDHRIPDRMGGEPTLENCQVLCTDGPDGGCHGIKTRFGDVPDIAQAKRREAIACDAKPPPKNPMRGGRHDKLTKPVNGPARPRGQPLRPSKPRPDRRNLFTGA